MSEYLFSTMRDADDQDALAWLDAPLAFTRRPDPLAPDFRPERRIGLCLMIVEKSWGGKATWKALHVVSWALQSPHRMRMLASIKNGTGEPDRPVVRFEPALDRALDLAVGLNYLNRTTSGSYSITDAGRAALAEIREAGVMANEHDALQDLTGKVSNKDVERLLEWRTQ